MSFPRYPKYKGSGVEWLGDVPEHWDVKRLKFNLRLRTEKTERRENPVALENIEGWTGRFIPTETKFEGEGIAFDVGDILFGKLRPYLAKVYCAESPGEAVGDFHVLRPFTGIDSRFAQYQILNRDFIDIVDGSTFGSKMPRASWESVGGMMVATPTPSEQKFIAAFLDGETMKIDDLVTEQRRLMELLKEKRQAVICEAVTKGLNPKVPMKPSGIEWIGDMPEHWEITKLAYNATVENGTTPSKDNLDYWFGGEIPWLSSGDVNQYRITEANDFITKKAFSLSPADGLKPIDAKEEDFDSSIERTFAQKWGSGRRDGWLLNHEDEVLWRGQRSFVPDFSFSHEDGRKVLFEVAGYWTPEYESAKRDTLRMFRDAKIILAVPAASAEKYEDLGVPMIVYKSGIKLEPVLEALKRY